MTSPVANAPGISVIIPTFQRRELACEAVMAIGRARRPGPAEIIVVVDGSTDGTAQALEAIDPGLPLRVIVQANGGLAHARNAGAKAASHAILLFLDDDMIADPGLLEAHAGAIAAGADAVVGAIPLDDRSPPGFLTEGIAGWASAANAAAGARGELTAFDVFGGQLSVRRDVFEALGGFDAAFTADGGYGGEDADFAARLLAGHTVRFEPRAISHHRYVVSASENLARAVLAGRADVAFARRHPRLARARFEGAQPDRLATRLVFRPLARVPMLARMLVAIMGPLADRVLRGSWRSSRHFARLFHAVRRIAYWASVEAAGGMPASRKALILCYHAIADHADDPVLAPYSIDRPMFETHIAALERRGFAFVSADALAAALEGEAMLPRKAVLLTFDDCYADLLPTVREILAPRDIPALAFAVTGLAGGSNDWCASAGGLPHRLLGWDDLRQLPALGCDIGSHSRSHRDLTQLDAAGLGDEVAGSADDFAANGLPRATWFAYPFGAHDAHVRAAVQAAGYRAGFAIADLAATRRRNRHALPRIEMLSSDTPWRFWFKTRFPTAATVLRQWPLRPSRD